MTKAVRVFTGAVLVFLALVLWMGAHPVAAGVSAAAAAVLFGWEFLLRQVDRHNASGLPRELERLAWRSNETAVAFIWRFRKGRDARVRILRSEEGYADRRTSTGHDQIVVFDAQGDQAVDGDVQPRRTYYYTFLVDRPTAHPATVRLEIPTLAADERRRIEATHEGSVALWSYERDGLTTSDRHGPGGSRTATSAVLGEILGGIATDAVFAVAELFDRERLPDEWIEVE